MKYLALVVLSFIFGVNALHAATRHVYVGDIEGTGKVVMELEEISKGFYRGRYFYDQKGVDIPVQGSADKLAEAVLRSELSDDKNQSLPDGTLVFTNSTTSFQGKMDGKFYRGEWVDSKADKKRPFLLQRINSYNASSLGKNKNVFDFIFVDSADSRIYNELKLNGHKVAEGSGLGNGGDFQFQYRKDTRTGVRYPYIIRYPDGRSVEKINRLIEQRHNELVKDVLECKAADYFIADRKAALALENATKIQGEIRFASKEFLSIEEKGSVYCWGATSNQINASILIDLNNGAREASWNDYLDFASYNKFGALVPNPALVDFIANMFKDSKNPVVNGTNCLGKDMIYESLTFFLDKAERLGVGNADLSHSASLCSGQHDDIALDALKDFWRPGAEKRFAEKPYYTANDKPTNNKQASEKPADKKPEKQDSSKTDKK